MAYSISEYDKLEPANEMKIDRSIRFREENADISRLTALPLEQLQTIRRESAAAEQAVYENLQSQSGQWEHQAAVTLLIDKAIEYNRFPAVKHTSNEWVKDSDNGDRQSISNMVYIMNYHVYENTRYDRAAEKSVPTSWDITWSVRTNAPNRYGDKIAGQQNKRYTDKSEMEKYLAGRIKAYAYLFTEISPPIPNQYADNFRVNGQLLPGYTLENEEFTPPGRAAEISGNSIVDQKLNELLEKERKNMNDPLNILLVNRETYITRESGNADGAWLKLPATAEQLNAALARISVQDSKNYYINGIETPAVFFDKISIENINKAGIDELNYLAARLGTLEPVQLKKMNAAVEVMADSGNIHRLIEFTHNTDFFVHNPGVFNHIQLGENSLYDSEMIQMPEEWFDAVDVEKLGEIVAMSDKGVFTEHGYIFHSGDEWKPVNEIPQEYIIAPKIEKPGIDYHAPVADAAVISDAKPAEKTQTAIPIVLTAENPRERLKEITAKLEAGIKGIFDSEQYKTYLQTLSKFHNYSFNNCILIAMQKPDASRVAGFNDWRDNFKRPVKKGEKGIKIIAPAPFKTTREVDRTDANGKAVFDTNGQRVKDQVEVTVPAFKVATVFDVSQTDGEPLPEIGKFDLDGNVERYKELFAAIEKTSPVPVAFEAIESGTKGYYHQTEKRIAINEGMSELDTLRVAIHEAVHSRLHAIDENAPKDEPRPDRRTREVEAESIAYVVCARYGLDTSESSFGYVAEWSGDKQLDTLKSSLDTIRKEAASIITEIDKHFAELTQNKEQTVEKSAPDQGDTFTIYQLKGGDETRNLRFEPPDRLEAAGLTVALENYNNIYTAPLDTDVIPEDIYFSFNMDKPEDFTGHSLSVSDVVVMNRNGKETAYYVDDIGFKELPDFLSPKEHTAEHHQGSPQWQEYTALGNSYPDSIVFQKLGDFYEVMGDNAKALANDSDLGFMLAGRDVGLPERVPMIGVPDHRLVSVVEKLNDKNYKVIIAENEKITERNPAPSIDLKVVADYMQKQYDVIQAADPNKATGQAAFDTAIKRLEMAHERIPNNPQLKALIINAAQSSDLPMLKERMETMHSDFIQHYSTAVQMTIDTSGKAETGTPTNTQSKGTSTKTQKQQPSIKEKIAAGKSEIAANKSVPAKAAAKNNNKITLEE